MSATMESAHLVTDGDCSLGRELIYLLRHEYPKATIIALSDLTPGTQSSAAHDQNSIWASLPPKSPSASSPPSESVPDASKSIRYLPRDEGWWQDPSMLDVEFVYLVNPDGYIQSSLIEAVSHVLLRTEMVLDNLLAMKRTLPCRWRRLVVQSSLISDDFAKLGITSTVKIYEGSTKDKNTSSLESLRHIVRVSCNERSLYSACDAEKKPTTPGPYWNLMRLPRGPGHSAVCTRFPTWNALCFNEVETLVHQKLAGSDVEVIILRLPALSPPALFFNHKKGSPPVLACCDLRDISRKVKCPDATPQFCPIDYACLVLISLAEWTGLPIWAQEAQEDDLQPDIIRSRIHLMTQSGFPILHLDHCFHLWDSPSRWADLRPPLMFNDLPRYLVSEIVEIIFNLISWVLLLIAVPNVTTRVVRDSVQIESKSFRSGLRFDSTILRAILKHFDDRFCQFKNVEWQSYLKGREGWDGRERPVNVLRKFETRSLKKLAAHYGSLLEENQKIICKAVVDEVPADTVNRKAKLEALRWMSSDFATSSYLVFGTIAHLILRKVFPQIQIDLRSLRRLSDLCAEARESQVPVLLIPSHQSYFDFVIISYTCLAFGLLIPMVAADESFSTIPLVAPALRASGAFFLRRDRKSTLEEVEILKIFFRKALQYHRWVQFFIEGGRSRTGYIGRPKKGLLAEGLSAHLVPVRISYVVCPEFESICAELSGRDKQAETFKRFATSAMFQMKQKDLVQVKVGAPAIPYKRDLHNEAPPSATAVSFFAWKIVYDLQDLHLISLQSLLASVLMYEARTEWSLASIVAQVKRHWTYIGSENFLDCTTIEPRDISSILQDQAPFNSLFYIKAPDGSNEDGGSGKECQHSSLVPSTTIQTPHAQRDEEKKREIVQDDAVILRKFSSTIEANDMSLKLSYFRCGLWDKLGLEVVVAVVFANNPGLVKKSSAQHDKVIRARVKVVAEYISGLVWGHRILHMSASEMQSRIDRVKLAVGSGRMQDQASIMWLRSIFLPLASGLELLFYELGRLLGHPHPSSLPIATGDFLKQCRKVAALQMWPLGCYPLLEVDLMRSVFKFGGYPRKSSVEQASGQQPQYDLPKTLPLDALDPKALSLASRDLIRRVAPAHAPSTTF